MLWCCLTSASIYCTIELTYNWVCMDVAGWETLKETVELTRTHWMGQRTNTLSSRNSIAETFVLDQISNLISNAYFDFLCNHRPHLVGYLVGLNFWLFLEANICWVFARQNKEIKQSIDVVTLQLMSISTFIVFDIKLLLSFSKPLRTFGNGATQK